ncbi:cytochrome c oxidase subunit 3 [Sphingomonas sp. CGMCC 1.13654]|uniref:Cytochrome c oxidase subunit 3 n=1 Tax=Sphingomonas chungangi TaxID=2683589 RepID=A0A838L6W2_9SPHN|nr:cytochrome c oxidase subunit 3 [Sphingomonas chungangi]MBA2934412.1 cytochrome c oxidase subunit 3 [Sphingomonas chungangi]MVW57451.1 cytochrome c oxidase subunit 3 family protein [Sphingomonas chungangi]
MSSTPILVEPFEEPERQREAMVFGLWLFLATEILFFGGFFFLYAVARMQDPVGFAKGAARANLLLGTVNTVLLMTSSATLTVAERAAQAGWMRGARGAILATLALGTAFLAVKGFEYREDLSEHLFPTSPAFPFSGLVGATRFWSFYWFVTIVHAIHLTIGLGCVARLLRLDLPRRWMVAEVTTLYWHFVDIIWLLLWPLLYLVGP